MSKIETIMCRTCRFYSHEKYKYGGLVDEWRYSIGICSAPGTLHLKPPEWGSCYLWQRKRKGTSKKRVSLGGAKP